jgi:hypothetical protein
LPIDVHATSPEHWMQVLAGLTQNDCLHVVEPDANCAVHAFGAPDLHQK